MSTTEVLLAYRRERLPYARFVPIASGLGAMSVLGGDAVATAWMASWLRASTAALLLIAQFRLWDDLADREVDRRLHPTRVLTRDISLNAFRWSVVLLGAINALLLATHHDRLSRLVVFTALCVTFALWYGVHRRDASASATMAEAHVVLLKYPLFVYLAAPSASKGWVPRLGVLLAVFAAASAYEILHDKG